MAAGLATAAPSTLTPPALLPSLPPSLLPNHTQHTRRPRTSGLPFLHRDRDGPARSLTPADCDRLAALYNKHKHSDKHNHSSKPDNHPKASSAGASPRIRSFSAQMATTAVPDSPPDLSSTRSTNSPASSFRSSVLSDHNGADVVTHFEDISLGDSKRDSYDLFAHKNLPPRVAVRPLHSAAGTRKKGNHAADTMRSVHMTNSRLATTNRLQLSADDRGLHAAPHRFLRSAYRSSSGGPPPSASARLADSRSPSPSKSPVMTHGTLQRSSTSIPGSSTHSFLAAPNLAGPSRRKTWAPGRKTVKQLEDEYHDSDEEVPEDAIIWNVPVSPLEPFTVASRDPSPRRMSSHSSLSSLHSPPPTLRKFPSAPSPAAIGSTARLTSASTPHLLHLPRSATTGSLYDEPATDLLSLRERHQSWTNSLSSEARDISLAIEAHNYSRRQSTDSKTSVGSPWHSPPQSAASRRQSNSSISLPPVQRGDTMIDPLPVSKEKEAVLTRTRPSWLPPKCQKEEKKHLKQWERMMAKSVEQEKRRADKRLSELNSEEDSNKAAVVDEAALEHIWTTQVLPSWDESLSDPRTRELWWRGIPASSRGPIWRRAIGNALELTSVSYAAALKRGRTFSSSGVLAKIGEDAALVFPETAQFATPEQPLHQPLVDVLTAHAAYRSDMPYTKATAHIAALLLLQRMSSEEAFLALENVLVRPLPQAYALGSRAGIERYTSLVLSAMKAKLPALHDHFLSGKVAPLAAAPASDADGAVPSKHDADANELLSPLSLAPAQYDSITSSLGPRSSPLRSLHKSAPSSSPGCSSSRALPAEGLIAPLLSSLLALHLPVEALTRVWDIYVFEGDKVLVRAYVGLCALVESRLYGSRNEVLALLGADGRDAFRGFAVAEVVAAVREAGKIGGGGAEGATGRAQS